MKEEKEIKKEYCPVCGIEMKFSLLPNETSFYRRSPFSIYPYEVEGDSFKRSTGEKLYRVELDCPAKEKKHCFAKAKSHYGRYVQEDLTRKEVLEKFNF